MNSETLWLIVNTLEQVQIVSTKDNLSKMLAAISTLEKMAKEAEATEEQGE